MGNDNLRRAQVAVEASYGTALTPTRGVVGALSLRNMPERVLRDEYRASMGASNVYDDLSYRGEGTYSARAVTSELPMFLAGAIVGVTAPVTTVGLTASTLVDGKGWVFTQPLALVPPVVVPPIPPALTALKSVCLFTGDQTQAVRAAGAYVSRIVIRGDNTSAVTVEVTFLTREVVKAGGGGPDFVTTLNNEVNETMKNLMGQVAITAGTGTMGTGLLSGQAYSYTWTWDSGIAPDYTMDLSLDMQGVHRDAPTATLELVTKWSADAVTEFDNYRGRTPRLIRVATYGNLIVPSGTDRHTLAIDGCYVATDFVPLDSERDGTTLARATFTAVENHLNLYAAGATISWKKKIEVTVVNDRATLAS